MPQIDALVSSLLDRDKTIQNLRAVNLAAREVRPVEMETLRLQLVKEEDESKAQRRRVRQLEAEMSVLRDEVAAAAQMRFREVKTFQEKDDMLQSKLKELKTQLAERVRGVESREDVSLLRREVQMAHERNRRLQTELDLLQPAVGGMDDSGLNPPTVYELLLQMAECMSQMGIRRKNLPGPEKDADVHFNQGATPAVFQPHVNKLVALCSKGFGLGPKEVGERQTRVWGLLADVYLVAGAKKEDEAGSRVVGGLTSGQMDKKKRVRM